MRRVSAVLSSIKILRILAAVTNPAGRRGPTRLAAVSPAATRSLFTRAGGRRTHYG
ncbi:putative signal peptide protein [Halorubrum sp. AJ67]|nr:putative signal peptide protein [Halorubrum sp. AJ67]